MTDILLANLTFYVAGSPVTSVVEGLTTAREYLGPNAPRLFRPRLISFANFRRDVVADGRTFGRSETNGGTLYVANPDGFYDGWIDYGFGGDAQLLLLDKSSPDYGNAVSFVGAKIRRLEMSFREISVHITDRAGETDLDFQTTVYLGTNSGGTGVEGLPNDLQGQPKPDALGVVKQVPVNWANETALVAHLDSERISAIADGEVYDGLVGLTRGTAHASLAALLGASPSAGNFDYYLGGDEDGAYIKLGSQPQYNVTADYDGKAPAGTFNRTPAALFNWILQSRAGVEYQDISQDDLDDLTTNAPYDLGMYFARPVPIREPLDFIAMSLPGYWFVDRNNSYRIKRLLDPSLQSATITLKVKKPTGISKADDGDIVNIQKLSINDAGGGVPAWSVRVRYQPIGQVTELGFDTASTQAIRSTSKYEWRSVVVQDTTISALNPMAIEMEFDTALVDEADAETVAAQLLSLYGVRRDRFRVTVRLTQALARSIDLGVVVSLQFPRFDLTNGKNFVVLGLRYRGVDADEVSQDMIELDLWG